MPEIFSQLLFTYGPYALLVFLAFVLERKAKNRIQQASSAPTDALENRIAHFTYAVTWVAIFITCGVITVVWIVMHVLPHEVTIKGRLTGLRGSEALTTPFSDMYLRRIYSERALVGVHWRIITPKKLPAGTEVDLFVDRSTPQHEDVGIYVLSISDELYAAGNEVALTYDRSARALSLGTKRLKVRQPEALMATEHRDDFSRYRWFSLVTPLYADVRIPLEHIAHALEANDAVLRTRARTDLASRGPEAIPFIQRVLVDRASSYRLRLGVIIALNNLRGAGRNPIQGDALCTIVKATRDPDPELSRQARMYMGRYSGSPPPCY